ncbi:TPA: hypothetical protein NY287_002876 [Escherichia coli]|nr:hypothetical protein [Escherichia coli]
MGKNIKERNQLADFARVFMAFIVVAIHVNIFYEHPALNKITVDGFFRIAVPFFLMINGYYFHENISHVESFKKWLKMRYRFIFRLASNLFTFIPSD